MSRNVSATAKYIRIAPKKIDRILCQIRGKSYKEALQILKYLPQKPGSLVWQTLFSAVSNASNNHDLNKNQLIVDEAFVNQGSILKRMRPRARGKAYRIEKKFSHITIRVSESTTNS
jgi:large subunit ribosomal protein L22